jgi:exopolyphosphatase/pppGpp-phosphohydrolase
MIRVYDGGVLIGEVHNPEEIAPFYTMGGLSLSNLYLDGDDLAEYYRREVREKIKQHREALEKTTTIQVNGSPHTIHTNLEAIAKLSMRASMGTDGFWMDIEGTMFPVSAAQFTQMTQQVSERGDTLYGWLVHHCSAVGSLTDPEQIKNYNYKDGWNV